MRDPAATVAQETPAAQAGPAALPRGRLFRKYVAMFVAVVSLALVLNGGFEIWFSYQEQQAALIRIQREQADAAAAKISQFIKEIESQLGWTTQLPWSDGTVEQRRFDALRLLRQVPAITELAQLDAGGKEQLRVSRLAMDVLGSGLDQSSEPKFTETVAKKAYYGPVYFRRESEPYMTLGLAGTRRDAGVSIAEVNLKFIWDVVSQIKVGEKGQAFVVDQRGRLIAHPDISLVLRNTDMSALPQVKAALGEGDSRDAVREAKNLQGKQVLTAASTVPALGWRVFVELPREEAYAPLYAAVGRSTALLGGGLLLALIAALVLARRMAGPIQRLRAGAARIGEGNLAERISIKTGDELEALADQFNDMAGRLQESYADLEKKVEVRTHELSESLQQQTATAEVLKVISRSTFELQPVLDTLVQSAAELCDADQGAIFLLKGDRAHFASHHGYPPEWVERVTAEPMQLDESTFSGLTIKSAKTINITDVLAEEHDGKRFAQGLRQNRHYSGTRSLLGVPLLRGGVAIGMFSLARKVVKPFTDKQIELVTTFADQAVIAIENTRLFDEVQARTKELTESLEQQTATSEVLQVISSSPGELKPVFETMLANATRICGANFGGLSLYDGEAFHHVAGYDMPPAFAEALQGRANRPHPGSGLAELVRTKAVVQIDDLRTRSAYLEGDPTVTAVVDLAGARTIVLVPMLKEGELIGSLLIYRQEVRPFNDKQIALLQSFANQAVIAIENARLLKELRQRTDDLSESLEQQTATSEVLQVISSSPSDLKPVFETMLANATRICGAGFGSLNLYDGEKLEPVAFYNVPSAYVETRQRTALHPHVRSRLDRLVRTKQVIHIEDLSAEASYAERDPRVTAMVDVLGIRTLAIVPMVKEGELIGTFTIYRQEARPFSDKQIALLKSFANQAVIAIENARLLKELRESLEQQTATSEVLQVISSSPGELKPVFETMLANATRICGAGFGMLKLYDGEVFRNVEFYNVPAAFIEARRDEVIRPHPESGIAELVRTKRVVQIEDLRTLASRFKDVPAISAAADLGGARTLVHVPMLKEGELVGSFTIYRQEVRPFSDKQIALLQGFANQAVIAIENARLLKELRQRTDDLSESLEQQTATSEVLRVMSTSPTDVRPAFETIVRNAVTLSDGLFANIFRFDGEMLHFVASQNVWPSYVDRLNQKYPMRPDRSQVAGRAMLTKSVVRVEDVLADPDYDQQFPAAMQWRRMLGVPMMREGVPRGVLVVGWAEPGPISKAQEEMIKVFADQGAIAIENVRLFDEVQARTKELTESLQQQTATADVLKVISRSAFELPPILQVLVESAARLCDAERAAIFLLKDGENHFAAHSGYSPEVVALAEANPIPDGFGISGRASREARTIHLVDAKRELADELAGDYARAEWQRLTGTRSALGVPLMRGQVAIGAFVLTRSVVKPFTSKQTELVTTFADQAVIAIENVRLFDEVQARTKELTESLQQQTATADVLKVISRSAFELQPVLDTLVESAVRLCGADKGSIFLRRGNLNNFAAQFGHSPDYVAYARSNPMPMDSESVAGRTSLGAQTVHVHDLLSAPGFSGVGEYQKRGGARTMLGVPLLRGGEAIGAFSISRLAVQPFTEKQIELVTTFADQAVIAIENVRLFDEVQARTKELTESLQQQTATADVLKVISRSAFDLQPVLDVLVETAAALCDADHAYVFRRHGEVYRLAASHGFSQDYVNYLVSQQIPVGRNTLVGRAALTAAIVHIPDAVTDPEYTWHESQRRGGFHTMLGVPLLRDGVPIGVVALTRCAISPFTQKQIDLVNTFADQAVIAIENVRLFDEVQARTKELTRSVEELEALGEVTQAVNSTLELQRVLDTIVAKAVQLSGTDAGAIYVFSNQRQKFRLRATYGMSAEMIEAIGQQTIRLGDGPIGEAAMVRKPVQAADLREEELSSPALNVVYGAGYRALLAIPLMRLNRVVGALVVRRRAPGAFADATVSLLETFAAQSVLAIQNARLFADIEEKGRQLEMASQHKSQFLANMSHELRTPMNAVLGFAEMLADGLYGELPPKARGALVRVQANGKHLLGLINDVLDLSKIEAGQLQLALDDYSIGQVVQTVMAGTEALARNKGLKLTASVKDGMPIGYGDERRLTQVLLNLVGNAIKFTDEGEVAIEAKAAGGLFELSVRDTGAGIAPEHQERIFEEFQQVDDSNTRQKGGTGLGLAISKSIVELHGGTIRVVSEVEVGSTFIVTLPVRAEDSREAAE